MPTYTFYSDPGHGWLKVPIKKLEELNIVDKISRYSYRRGAYAYLEEDCDVRVFRQAEAATGAPPSQIRQARQANRQSKIRSYESFK